MFSTIVFFALFCLCKSQDSICDKYSQALNVSNKGLVSKVVNDVVGRVVANGTTTKKYFDGTKPAGSTNFLDAANAQALKDLVASLVQFFGAALDCSDGTITPYTGPSMDKVHQPMGISSPEFVFFNDQVVQTLAVAGVTEQDQVAVRIVLNGLKTSIVSQNSICDRYSNALKVSNRDLVRGVVLKVFTRITDPNGSPIRKYFDGTKPRGSLNFLNPKNSVALEGLVHGLTTWFGAALGCSDDTIPPYGGPPLSAVHRVMKINLDEFNFFNTQVLGVLLTSGVAKKDLQVISGALNSTRADIVSA